MNPLDIASARFRPIRQAREHAAKAEATQAQSRARLEELRGRVSAVEHSDRQALGAALVAGKAEPASEAQKLKAEIAEEERRAEALTFAVTDAHNQVGRLVKANRDSWRAQAMRSLGKERGRYEAAIAELEAAREGLAAEATLIAWLDGGPGEDASNDRLGGSLGLDKGEPVSFSRTLDVFRRDCQHLTDYPVTRNDPHPEPRFELMQRAG